MHDVGGCPLTLHFERLGGTIPLETWSFRGIEYNPVHDRLVATDGWNVYSISPQDGSHRVLKRYAAAAECFISCIEPATGDAIMGVRMPGKSAIDFSRLSMTGAGMSEISLSHLNMWGSEPVRLIFLENGERVVFAADPHGEPPEVYHYDEHWGLLGWHDTVLDETTSLPDAPRNRTGIFDCSGHAIAEYNFESRANVILAGCEDTSGCVDGVGAHARFSYLRLPTVNDRHLFVRTYGTNKWEWRLVRLDLKTLQAESIHVSGFHHDELLNFCASEAYLYALVEANSSTRDDYKVQLLRAPLNDAGTSPGLVPAMASVDLRTSVRSVAFRLAGGTVLEVDRRLLVARSEYFGKMLSSGLIEDRNSEVDLSSDETADAASVSVMLHFVMSDSWVGPQDDMDLALRVRVLADRYQFPRLVGLAEGHLLRVLGPDSVLSLLGRIIDSGGTLERACWELLDAQGAEIMAAHESELDAIIRQSPLLAKRLILWRSDMSGSPGKRVRRL